MRAAWRRARGERPAEVSMAKIQIVEVLHLAVDTAIQLLGARGHAKDTPLEWMYRYARLVDGASEVHRMLLARERVEDARVHSQRWTTGKKGPGTFSPLRIPRDVPRH
jgi:acyl-CoA dehydrogenase